MNLEDLSVGIDLGLKLLPCQRNGKRPLTRHGVKDASADPEQIRRWDERSPGCNWGAAMGRGYLALDVDVKKGKPGLKSLEELQERHSPLPVTLKNLTWSGGFQLIYRFDEDLRIGNSAGRLGPGLDVKADGGYIVVPPSSIDGKYYIWDDPTVPVAWAPDWLLELSGNAGERCRAVEEGSRNDALTRHLGKLRARGATDDEILREAFLFNERRCKPPLPDREVRAVVRSATGWKRQYAQSDMGNARRFLDSHRGDVRYVVETREWIEWHPEKHCWVSSAEGLGCIARIKSSIVEALGAEVAEQSTVQSQQGHARWLISSQNTHRLEAALANSKSEPGVTISRQALDANPHVFGTRNGVFDLATGEHRPGRREDFITKRIGCDFVPGATAPRFQQFLMDQVSPEMADYLRRLAGLTLIGNRLRLLLFIYGPSKSGKSVFIETLKGLMGDYGRAASSDLLMSKSLRSRNGPTESLARLAGARLVTVNETGSKDEFDEALIKDLTGGDTISARELYKGSFDFRPEFVIWIRGNHKPRFSGSDVAMLERIRLVPFVRRRPEGERDVGLLTDILQHELSGVLNWAISGAIDVLRDGRIDTPEEVAEATQEYGREMDLLGLWIADACRLGTDCRLPSGKGYASFVSWCRAQGIVHPWTRLAWARAMGERFEKRRIGDIWHYLGIWVETDEL